MCQVIIILIKIISIFFSNQHVKICEKVKKRLINIIVFLPFKNVDSFKIFPKKLLTFQKLTLQTLNPSKSNFQTSHNSPFKPSNIHRSTEARPNRIQTIWRVRVFQAHWMMCIKNYKFDLVRLAQLNLLLKHVFISLRFNVNDERSLELSFIIRPLLWNV